MTSWRRRTGVGNEDPAADRVSRHVPRRDVRCRACGSPTSRSPAMTANPIPQTAVDALYDELFRVGRYLHAPVPIDPKEIIRRHLTAAQQQRQATPPSTPVGVEGLLADLETIWHSVSDDKETNAAYQRLKSALSQQTAAGAVDVRIIARDIHYAIMDDGLAPLSNADNHKVREAILRGLQAVLAAEGVQAEPKAEAQLTYKGVPIGPMQTFADIERQVTVPADPRAAAEQAISEALRRERMAPDDYAPMPDAPVPMEHDPNPPTPEEVAEAFREKYGLAQEAD